MGSLEDITVTISDSDAAGRIDLLSGSHGASLRSLTAVGPSGDPFDVILGYQHKGEKMGGQGDVLIPFPGRVALGRYTFEGTQHQMHINDKDGPNAIHGFLRELDWTEDGVTENEVSYTGILDGSKVEGYPFHLKVRITYRVENMGMTCSYEIENTGETDAPVAAGFHPYFTAGDEWCDDSTLLLPMNSILEFGDDLIPTGRMLGLDGSPYDYRVERPIGDTKINNCYCDPIRDADGRVRFTLASSKTGRKITVWMDEAIDYVVLYTGDVLPDQMKRRGLAIEPMTCGSDAFNHTEWGLVSLKPGETTKGQWGVTVSL